MSIADLCIFRESFPGTGLPEGKHVEKTALYYIWLMLMYIVMLYVTCCRSNNNIATG